MMPFFYIFDRDGKPISIQQWIRILEKNPEYRNVKQEHTPGKTYRVSTIWLGHNHNYGPGKPLIFESMVFKHTKKGTIFRELDCDRYSTEQEALEGHKALLAKYTKIEEVAKLFKAKK